MFELKLKATANRQPRVVQGHPWVFAGEAAAKLPPEANGEGVLLKDSKGRVLGSGIYNASSKIVWRRYSREARPLDRTCLEELLITSFERRPQESFRRLVWSEADDLPGLIVDQYNDQIVLQTLTLAMDKRSIELGEIVSEALEPDDVIFRNDAPGRKYEGLPLEVFTRSGKRCQPRWFEIDGLSYFLDLMGAQKTGFYLDQRQQHKLVASYARERRVLDAFCNQGAFALQCAKAGAASVLGVDASETSIDQARRNAARNGLNAEFEVANMFDFFTQRRDQQFDLIILDPPSFARNKLAIKGALRGYKELNLRAMNMLSEGGILATYSCSQNVTKCLFYEMLSSAASDTGRKVRILAETGQPADHPVLINVPETQYLKGYLLQIE